jgi:FixJ family two-component response regulator
MPNMSGTELAKHMKAEHPETPFIIISGVNDLPTDAPVADQFISKLAGTTALFQAIDAALNPASAMKL